MFNFLIRNQYMKAWAPGVFELTKEVVGLLLIWIQLHNLDIKY